MKVDLKAARKAALAAGWRIDAPGGRATLNALADLKRAGLEL